MKAQHILKRRLLHTFTSLITLGALLAAGLEPSVAAHSDDRPAARAHYGGTITLGLFDTPACLDPLKYTSGQVVTIWSALYDTLVSQDERGRDRAGLAMRWSYSHGGRQIIFFLRHGVRFSNGDPVEAKAVKFTLEHDARWAPVGRFLGPITKVQVLGTYTVRLVLPAPSRPLLDSLATPFLGILDPKVESGQADTTCQAPVGSGPFKFEDRVAGKSKVSENEVRRALLTVLRLSVSRWRQ